MSRSRVDDVWRLCVIVVVEILNPLLLISLALFVSVGYILTLMLPVNVDIWAGLAVACILLALIPLSLRARRIWRSDPRPLKLYSWRILLPIVPLLPLLLVFIVMLSQPSLTAIAHIDLYFSYVMQVYHSSTPLENIFVPGYPANHYWLFHALIAAIIRLTSLDTFSVFLVLNFVYLTSALLWLARTILALNLAKPRTIYVGIVVIFVFGALNATGPLSNLSHLLADSFEWGNLQDTLLSGADRRLHGIFVKVFHASAMTLGITAFTAALFVCVSILRERLEIMLLVMLSASGIAGLGVMPVATLFIVCVLLAGLALTAILAWRSSSAHLATAVVYIRLTVERLKPHAVSAWLVLSLLLSIPLLRYFDQFTGNFQSGMSFAFLEPTNLSMTFAASALLLPLVGMQIGFAFVNANRLRTYIASCSLLGLIVVLGVQGPDQNQYKLHYLLCMIFALAALLLVEQWSLQRRGARFVALRIYVAGLIALAIVNSAYGLFVVVDAAVRRGGTANFEGIHIRTHDIFDGRKQAFNWIRDNTPMDAVIIVPHKYTTRSLLFHERLNYVSNKYYNFTDVPAFDKRINELYMLYDPAARGETYDSLIQSMQVELPGRPFYAVVEYSELDPEQMRERGAQQVFNHPENQVAVYLLNPP